MEVVLVALGAAVGAPARFVLERLIQSHVASSMPWGTWTVNVLGSLVAGFVLGVADVVPPELRVALATGFCGAFTTVGSFAFQVVHLAGTGRRRTAFGYVLASVAVGVAAAGIGFGIGGLVT